MSEQNGRSVRASRLMLGVLVPALLVCTVGHFGLGGYILYCSAIADVVANTDENPNEKASLFGAACIAIEKCE